MLKTSARLLELLSLLQTRRDWAGAELAARLGVSTRTVRRDVDRLRDLGYPVHATRGSAGYRLGAGAALPPLLLDDEEAVAVAVSLGTAAGGSVAGIGETAVRALAKLEQVLPSRLRHRVRTLQQATVRAGLAPGPQVPAATLVAIAEACRRHERLRFDYADHTGAASRREVEPHSLVSWGRRWYVIAWDAARGDWRTFRVDRLTPKSPGGAGFTPREPPCGDVAVYLERQLSSRMWPYRATVLLHESATAVAGRIWPGTGTLEPVDDTSCLLHVGADTLHALVWMITSVDAAFTLADGPPELAEALRRQGERCLHAVTGRSAGTAGPAPAAATRPG
ncbi:YafY family protein [Amycolatopsis sp. ATCC 39116]|uniref:helix-turn-helix transcriptional regulator n=1 Tax=Amycolatopsis sp. (strain ATCC 39116 / 75iv2) TaxID=385957 RepID=UPI0002628906|nr:YafY family protein [Amycolatopsis sp. ATCC 39116]